MGHAWAGEEAKVRAALEPELREYLTLLHDCEAKAFRLLCATQAPLRQPQEIYEVHARLLARVLRDARACELAARDGYTMQAWALAASAYEAGYGLVYVGENESRARLWLDHVDPEKTPWSPYCAITCKVDYLWGGDGAAAEKEYRQLYRELCKGKHANPLVEEDRYFRTAGGATVLRLSPSAAPRTVQEAQQALVLAARAVLAGMLAFHHTHANPQADPPPSLSDLVQRMVPLAERIAK